eukprot:10874879-Alexandrium_andersonii.AAC.1
MVGAASTPFGLGERRLPVQRGGPSLACALSIRLWGWSGAGEWGLGCGTGEGFSMLVLQGAVSEVARALGWS